MRKMENYYAVVYNKLYSWPVRHICKVNNIPRTPKAFFEQYYKEFSPITGDAVKFFDNGEKAGKFDIKLSEKYYHSYFEIKIIGEKLK